MILDILKPQINKMALQDKLITDYGLAVRRNVRRLHELEFVMQKYSKVCDLSEQFDKKLLTLEAKLEEQTCNFNIVLKTIKKNITEDIPDAFA